MYLFSYHHAFLLEVWDENLQGVLGMTTSNGWLNFPLISQDWTKDVSGICLKNITNFRGWATWRFMNFIVQQAIVDTIIFCYVYSLEVNHHLKSGASLLDDDTPLPKTWWFVKQTIKIVVELLKWIRSIPTIKTNSKLLLWWPRTSRVTPRKLAW